MILYKYIYLLQNMKKDIEIEKVDKSSTHRLPEDAQEITLKDNLNVQPFGGNCDSEYCCECPVEDGGGGGSGDCGCIEESSSDSSSSSSSGKTNCSHMRGTSREWENVDENDIPSDKYSGEMTARGRGIRGPVPK